MYVHSRVDNLAGYCSKFRETVRPYICSQEHGKEYKCARSLPNVNLFVSNLPNLHQNSKLSDRGDCVNFQCSTSRHWCKSQICFKHEWWDSPCVPLLDSHALSISKKKAAPVLFRIHLPMRSPVCLTNYFLTTRYFQETRQYIRLLVFPSWCTFRSTDGLGIIVFCRLPSRRLPPPQLQCRSAHCPRTHEVFKLLIWNFDFIINVSKSLSPNCVALNLLWRQCKSCALVVLEWVLVMLVPDMYDNDISDRDDYVRNLWIIDFPGIVFLKICIREIPPCGPKVEQVQYASMQPKGTEIDNSESEESASENMMC